jgi:hypothetical protein
LAFEIQCSQGEEKETNLLRGGRLSAPELDRVSKGEAKEKIQGRAKDSLATALNEEMEYERKLKIVKRVFLGGQVMEDAATHTPPARRTRYRY